MQALNFYDLKTKQSFTSSNYRIEKKSGRTFAVTTAPSGATSYRIVKA